MGRWGKVLGGIVGCLLYLRGVLLAEVGFGGGGGLGCEGDVAWMLVIN